MCAPQRRKKLRFVRTGFFGLSHSFYFCRWGVEFRQLGVRILSARLHGLLSKLQNARHSDAAQEIRVREIGSVRVQSVFQKVQAERQPFVPH